MKNKSDTRTNRCNWNHFKIIHKITEQHNGKVRNRGTTKNFRLVHCTQTSEITNKKYKIYNKGNSITCTVKFT